MRKRYYRLISLVLTIAGSAIFAAGLFAYPSGSPAGYTGSPGDGQHCQSCHGGSNATVNGWITTNIPSAGYTPGTTYTITATVSGTGKKGFEVSPQSVTGTQLGTLAAGSNNHLVGGTKYVTQNSSGSTSSTVVYNFSWTAPAAGLGPVTFYGAFTVGKQNTKLSTTVVTENAAVPLTATATATPGTSCSGQTVQLDVTVAGGSGNYTYSWTSLPPGFFSTISNPTANPVIPTQYNVHVSDGTSAVDPYVVVSVIESSTAAAGNDTTCAYIVSAVPYSGTAQFYSAVEWTTSGTGTFSAPASLSGNYLPSIADKDGGVVELTLNAIPQPPCTLQAEDTRLIYFDAPIGVSEKMKDLDVAVTPNPSDGNFSLRTGKPGVFRVSVTNLNGVEIYRNTIINKESLQHSIQLLNQPAGIYFVKVNSEAGSQVLKLVIK
jgi:hypothetical protein